MNITKFHRPNPDSLILVQGRFPKHKVALALDTGASHTTIDLSAMMIAGYDLSEAESIVKIETASGIIDAYVIKVRSFAALGITRHDIMICAYDFFAHHVLSEFDGVLGLDFFGKMKLSIDFRKCEIELS